MNKISFGRKRKCDRHLLLEFENVSINVSDLVNLIRDLLVIIFNDSYIDDQHNM